MDTDLLTRMNPDRVKDRPQVEASASAGDSLRIELASVLQAGDLVADEDLLSLTEDVFCKSIRGARKEFLPALRDLQDAKAELYKVPIVSAHTLLQHHRNHAVKLSCGSDEIDGLLSGGSVGCGLVTGTITELVGGSSTGKTQLCLAATIRAASCGVTVAFIDTNNSFCPYRLKAMHRLLEVRYEKSLSSRNPKRSKLASASMEYAAMGGARGEQPGLLRGTASASARASPTKKSRAVLGGYLPVEDELDDPPLNMEASMHNVRVFRAFALHDLLDYLGRLHAQLQRAAGEGGGVWLAATAQVGVNVSLDFPRLVVIDCVAAVVAPILGGLAQGHALMMHLSRLMKSLANEFHIAFLLTNNVTSAGDSSSASRAHPVAALGETWSIVADNRVLLHKTPCTTAASNPPPPHGPQNSPHLSPFPSRTATLVKSRRPMMKHKPSTRFFVEGEQQQLDLSRGEDGSKSVPTGAEQKACRNGPTSQSGHAAAGAPGRQLPMQ